VNGLEAVRGSLESELNRCSQGVDGVVVLPNAVTVKLPEAEFGRYAPVLQAVTDELGGALRVWAAECGHLWFSGRGPWIEVLIESRASVAIDVELIEVSES
jgi:hypothetical protein